MYNTDEMDTSPLILPDELGGERMHDVTNPRADLSAEQVRRLFSYDRETGALIWIGSAHERRQGTRAGYLRKVGYRYVEIGGREYKEHRIIWLHQYGRWPDGQIDHINGVPDDNRIENLRNATPSENQANKGVPACNRTGLKGAKWRKGRGFYSVIKKEGKAYDLGTFASAQEAHEAYCAAAKRLYGEFAKV